MADKVKYAGVLFECGGESLIVPPLSARQLKELTPTIADHDAIETKSFADSVKRLDLRITIVLPAIQRNYPGIDRDKVEQFMDLDNADSMFFAALGLDRKAPKTNQPPGE